MAAQAHPVDLVIRFTAAIPDLVLNIPMPSTTTILSLKRLIRDALPTEYAASRLRLISSGKVLIDTTAISTSIVLPPPPRARKDDKDVSNKGKGRATLGEDVPLPSLRVYIHCSVGDSLTSEELVAEEEAAIEADAALDAKQMNSSTVKSTLQNDVTTSLPPAPRGFDRLLTAGFSAAEVATLRTQFLAIQAHTHTPDTMPTGDEMRALEDRWLDSEAGATGQGGGTSGDDLFSAEDGGLEDMLWGNVMGFFWPVAAVWWLMREEGIWTRRRQISVLSGFLVNLVLGSLTITT